MKSSVFVLSLVAAIAVPQAQAAAPWDAPFAADTVSIQRAALAIQADPDAVISFLLDDHRYSIDKTGRVRYTARQVYRVFTNDDIDDWANAEASYQPWRGEKPQIRARVIMKDGSVHWLDQKTLTDVPSTQFDANMFSDDRVVRAPLPAIAADSIVEVEITGSSAPGIPEMGVSSRISVNDTVPLQRFHLTIESAKGAPAVQTASALIPDSAIKGRAPGAIEVELGPIARKKTTELNLPPDVARRPWFAFSTGATWNAIAARYSDLVDQKIQGADLKALIEDIDLTGPVPVVAARLVTRLHREIRYTGVELGESALIPSTPADVIHRRYGDCKDKSTLLVAMLRAAGLKAYVALLRAGPGLDSTENLPGGDLFDHAIVYVASQPGLWIDATASATRVGSLPPDDQGRLALIAAHGTTGLKKTDDVPGAWERKTFDVRFSDYGYGALTEQIEGTNSVESGLRDRYREEAKTKELLEKYVKSSYRAKSLGHFAVTGRDDLGSPFVVTAEATDTPQVFTTDDSAKIELAPGFVLNSLPGILTEEPDADEKPEPRKSDFYFPEAINTEYIYRLHPPALFREGTLPAAKELKYGPLTWSRSYTAAPDGSVEVRYKVISSKRRLLATEYEEIYKALHVPGVFQHDVIRFVPVVAEYAATGQTAKAISMLREDVAQHPDNAAAHIRLSRLLLNSAMGMAARAEARRATEVTPKSSQAWQALGWTLQHDILGRRFEGDWDFTESEKSYRKALEIDPDDLIAGTDLAILLEHNAHGVRYGTGSRMNEAIALYEASLAKQANPVLENNLEAALVKAGRIDEAWERMKKNTPDAQLSALYTTIHEGAGKAIVELQSAFPEPTTRSQQLAVVGFALMRMQRYDDARLMLTAASRSANAQQLAPMLQLMSRLKKREDVMFPESDLRALPQRFMLEILTGMNRERLRTMLSPQEKFEGFEKGAAELRAQMAVVQRQLSSVGLSEDNLVDFAMSSMSIQLEGDDEHGYRASLDFVGQHMALYLARFEGEWRILSDSESPEEVGELVLSLLGRKKIEEAQWWLDKIVNDLQSSKDSIGMPIEKELWSGVVPETRGATYIRRTAASLMARFSKSSSGIQILKDEIAKTKDAVELGQLNAALCEAYLHNEDWPQLAACARTLAKSKPYEERAFEYLALAERRQKQWKELEAAAIARQAASQTVTVKLTANARSSPTPVDFKALDAQITARIFLGNFDGATELVAKLGTLWEEQAREATAWIRLLSGKTDESVLADLSKDERHQPDPYTKAALQLALDHPDDARDSLILATKDSEFDTFDSRAWVIHGLIAKKYGLTEEASADWQRAREAKNKTDTADWSLALIPN